MTSPLDIVIFPGTSFWGRRAVVEAWVEAGKPKLVWGGRTYEEQKRLWKLYNTWRNGKRVGNAADNPDANTRQPHVRGMAIDLAARNPSAAVVKRLEAAGFVRPIWKSKGFSQDEPWHFELKQYVNRILDIPKVTAAAAGKAVPFIPTPIIQEDDMALFIAEKTVSDKSAVVDSAAAKYVYDPQTGKAGRKITREESASFRRVQGTGAVVFVTLTPTQLNKALAGGI